jgi:hypothetical protein
MHEADQPGVERAKDLLRGFSKEMSKMSILERLARQLSESIDLKLLQSKEYDR